jgi:hypothetical protein
MTTDDPTLLRVRQLIGMTGSSNIEEARSMALAACHMVLKHGLIISLPPKAGEAVSPSISPDDFPFSPTIQGVPPPRRPAPVSSTSKPSKPKVPRPKGMGKKKDGWFGVGDAPQKLASKYSGACKACGERYGVGDLIYWKRDVGVTHQKCGTKALEG